MYSTRSDENGQIDDGENSLQSAILARFDNLSGKIS